MAKTQEGEGVWVPRPVDDSKIGLPNEIQPMKVKFAEHFHDSWSARKLEKGWTHGELYRWIHLSWAIIATPLKFQPSLLYASPPGALFDAA